MSHWVCQALNQGWWCCVVTIAAVDLEASPVMSLVSCEAGADDIWNECLSKPGTVTFVLDYLNVKVDAANGPRAIWWWIHDMRKQSWYIDRRVTNRNKIRGWRTAKIPEEKKGHVIMLARQSSESACVHDQNKNHFHTRDCMIHH